MPSIRRRSNWPNHPDLLAVPGLFVWLHRAPARVLASGCMALWALVSGCAHAPSSQLDGSRLVTSEIQAAIENHIEEESRRTEGEFRVPYRQGELRLKLVRVHTEYLATLAPERHFACVDLVGSEGPIYDVDFFLQGPPGAMRVTETHVHKINAQPLYTWSQRRDGSWRRRSVQGASGRLLGVLRGEDAFEFLYRFKIPPSSEVARAWVPVPQTDLYQNVEILEQPRSPAFRTLTDSQFGNTIRFYEFSPSTVERDVALRYRVRRREKTPYYETGMDPRHFLSPEILVPKTERFDAIAQDVTRGQASDLYKARALYQHTIEQIRYAKYGPGWGRGDAVHACDARSGNCTDFHAYFIALARAAGIPARFAVGAAIPSERQEGGIDGYHCWAEFFAEGKWWPVDISEADKHSRLADYYFGHHPANRLEFTRGRDLQVDPMPASGPINFLAYPVLEIGGRPTKAETTFLFRRTPHERGLPAHGVPALAAPSLTARPE
jgi:transglutaminase-like putative cysteine protease